LEWFSFGVRSLLGWDVGGRSGRNFKRDDRGLRRQIKRGDSDGREELELSPIVIHHSAKVLSPCLGQGLDGQERFQRLKLLVTTRHSK
jgi:hypothetical protein